MTIRRTAVVLLALVIGLLAVPSFSAEEKADDALLKVLKEADAVFTGKIGKVNPLGQTNSIPPNTFGEITFKDAKALRGTVAEAPKYSYSYKEGTTKNVDLKATEQVLVAVKGKSVSAIVPATETNLALAKKALEGKEK
jgi:hypothetical protein